MRQHAVSGRLLDGKIFGTVNNKPEIVKTVGIGQRMSIPEAEISDWLYKRDGKMAGNYTLRALFKTMPAKEIETYKKMPADPYRVGIPIYPVHRTE